MHSSILRLDYIVSKNKNNLSKSLNFKKILKKTGIKETFKADINEDVLNLAEKLCKKNYHHIKGSDGLIFVTQTPRYLLPSCSCILQDKLGLPKTLMTFDINMGCSGFIYSLAVANSLISNNTCKKITIICSDTYNSFFDVKNRNRLLFSDAASVCIIGQSKIKKIGKFIFNTDGSGYDDIIIKENIKKKLEFQMNGSNVYSFTLNVIPKLINDYFNLNNTSIKNYNKVIFHQASRVILESLREKLKFPKEKFLIDLKFGNTTSSTIPITLKRSIKINKIKKGENILLCGFGVGLSCGATSIKL